MVGSVSVSADPQSYAASWAVLEAGYFVLRLASALLRAEIKRKRSGLGGAGHRWRGTA